MFERNPGNRSGRDRTLDQEPLRTPGLLVERARRNGKDDHRADNCGKDVRRRTAWGFVLLLAGLSGPEKPPPCLPHSRRPARVEVLGFPIALRAPGQVGPGNRS